MGSVRKVELAVTYNDVTNITKEINADLLSFQYNDNESGEKDDISIQLKDNHGRWRGEWLPTKGDSISCAIILDGQRLQCGTFAIDEISCSGFPNVCDIKASSAPRRQTKTASKGDAPKGGAINEKRTRNFESMTLKQLASKVASECGLTLQYLPANEYTFPHSSQQNESGYTFIKRLAGSRGCGLKCTPSKLIIMEQKRVDSGEYVPAHPRVELNIKELTSWNFTTQAATIVQSVTVAYYDPKKRKTITVTEVDKSVDNGVKLRVNTQCGDEAEARDLARSKLRLRNAAEVEGAITLPGRLDIVAGVVVHLTGIGSFDGDYTVDKCSHSVTGGYEVSCSLKKSKTNI